MLFPTVEFAIFFPIVLALSWALMPRQQVWKPFIVVASYVFYAAADPRFCLLLASITLVSQLAVVAIHRTDDERLRKWFTAGGVVFDLGILAVFKYYGFFVTDVSDVLDSIGLGMPLPLVTIALPVGVSFFSFQAVTYVVDVKRRQTEPASLLDAAIYLSFFPHLVAGPIVRASEFLPQLREPRDPDRVAVGAGLSLIALGLIKKVMIADYLAREVVDKVFAVPQAYSAPDAILGAYAYAAQIFCDFSGYTDMAIGLALLMGFVFPQNFNSPYRATGFRDFWRRWHMTLSRFLRDYLYIPLGGNRKGRVRTYINLMLTMALGGLWHGAAWNFVFWGTYQGAGLSAEHAINGRLGRIFPGWLRWFVTFNLIVLGWILFRSTDLTVFGDYMSALVRSGPATLYSVPVVGAIALVVGLQLLPERPMEGIELRIGRLQPLLLGVALAVVVLVVGATVPSQGVPLHLLPILMPKTPERFETIAQMEAEARAGREGEPHGDDSLMERFDRWGLRRFSGWDAVKAVALMTFLLLIFAGGSVRKAADELKPGLGRDIVKAIGGPAGWISDRLPFADTRRDLTSWLSPDQQLSGHGFTAGGADRASRLPAGVPSTPQPLHKLLVTGDSLSTPLDIEIARKLADQGAGVQVTRDPHLATGISNTGLVDWGQLSSSQASEDDPDAVVLFIGANEGYPMPGPSGGQVSCCGPAWESAFESRVGQMMDNYLNGGVERIYWLTVPTQRDPARKPIADAVNQAIRQAAASRGAAVRVIDLVPTFTPGDSYRDSIDIDGKQTIVRESDGIHLNDDGSSLAADLVLQAVDRDFDY